MRYSRSSRTSLLYTLFNHFYYRRAAEFSQIVRRARFAC